MSYRLSLQDLVVKKLRHAGLSGHVMREILEGCDRVGQDPGRHLIRVGPPDDAMQFDLVIDDSERPPRKYLFVFTVKYHSDEETLHVINCDFLLEEGTD